MFGALAGLFGRIGAGIGSGAVGLGKLINRQVLRGSVMGDGRMDEDGAIWEFPRRNPNYHGTPPFVYDPNHPYYREDNPDPGFQPRLPVGPRSVTSRGRWRDAITPPALSSTLPAREKSLDEELWEAQQPPRTEPTEYDISGTTPMPQQGSAGPRSSRDIYEDIQNSKPDVGRSKKKSFWGRLGGGAWNAFKNWDPARDAQGGGLLLPLMRDSLGSAFDPNYHAQMKNDQRLAGLMGQYRNAVTHEDKVIDQETKIAQGRKTNAEAIAAQNKAALDRIMADRIVTPAEAASYEAITGSPIEPGNYNEPDNYEVNGDPQMRYKTGPKAGLSAPDTSRPADVLKTPRFGRTPSGIVGYDTFHNFNEIDTRRAEAQAGRDQQAAITNVENELRADISNAQRSLEWAKTTTALRTSLVDGIVAAAGGNAEVQAQADIMRRKGEELDQISSKLEQIDPETQDPKPLIEQFSQAQKAYDDAYQSAAKALGRTTGGAAQVEQLAAVYRQVMQNAPNLNVKPRRVTPARYWRPDPALMRNNQQAGTEGGFGSAVSRIKRVRSGRR